MNKSIFLSVSPLIFSLAIFANIWAFYGDIKVATLMFGACVVVGISRLMNGG